MCVIIISPRGHKLPTKRELKAAYTRNHDGCGYVSETSHYKCLDFDEFYSHLKKVPKSENCIIHFRWATHGSVKVKNCHPFYDNKSHAWFAHNGILNVRPVGDTTDSETAFRYVLAPAIYRYGIYSPEVRDVANSIIGGSRFAFMQDGELRVFGHYYKYGDCFYSNLNHLGVLRYAL